MLQIRKAHQSPFERDARQGFFLQMQCHLRGCFAEILEGFSDEEMREFIERNWIAANSYGLKSERAVCDYVSAATCLGEQFPKEEPILREILGGDTDQATKAESMNEQVELVLAARASSET